MKQGPSRDVASGQKREPIPHAKDPGGVSQIGGMVAKNPAPIDAGRGFRAPHNTSEDCHRSGSQGKHK